MSSYTQVLVEKGLVTVEDIDTAERVREDQGLRLDQALIQNGALSEQDFLKVMGERLDFEIVDLPNSTIEDEAIRSLPSRFVYRNHLAPIARENGTLKVATSDPFDLYVFDEIKLLTGLQVSPVLAPRNEIDKVINICRNGERTLMLARLSVASTIETQNVVAVVKTPSKPAEPG